MIKITSSDKIIRLVSNSEHFKPESDYLHFAVSEQKELIDAYNLLLGGKEVKEIIFSNSDQNFLLDAFKSIFKVIEAAGGLVKNEKNEYLFIFRNGRWDLPKGKIEKGESVETAAIREVEEECGIGKLKIIRQLETTYHTYTIGSNAILKPTYWFEMSSSDNSVLTPQTEEGITEVKWVAAKDFKMIRDNTFPSILDIISGI
jgi:8-oxo-dGTP pyrophosphatase MutT (NUDIX family)